MGITIMNVEVVDNELVKKMFKKVRKAKQNQKNSKENKWITCL